MTISKIPGPFHTVVYFSLILFVIEILLPFQFDGDSAFKAKALTLGFYIILAVLGSTFVPRHIDPTAVKLPNEKLINFIRLATLFGPIFLLIDRLYIRELDITSGVSYLRYEMQKNSSGGVSSIFSILGYLGSAQSFWLLTRLIVFPSIQNYRSNVIDVFLIASSILGISLLTGGRTTLFILFGFIYSSLYCRINLLKNKIYFKAKSLIYVGMMLILVLYYVNYVFKDRATLNNINTQEYYSSIISYLHGKEKPGTNLSDKSDFYIYSQLTLAYFVHQFWVLQKTMDLPENFKKGDAVFVGWKTIFAKTNLIRSPESWYYGGFYIPFVGVFIYEFGNFLGFIMCLCFITIVSMITSLGLKITKKFMWFFWFNLTNFIVVFSLILPTTDILMMPMIVISMFTIYPVLQIFTRLRFRLA